MAENNGKYDKKFLRHLVSCHIKKKVWSQQAGSVVPAGFTLVAHRLLASRGWQDDNLLHSWMWHSISGRIKEGKHSVFQMF